MLLLSVELLGLIRSQHMKNPPFEVLIPCEKTLYLKAAAYVNTIFSRFFGAGQDFFLQSLGKVVLYRATNSRFSGISEKYHKVLCFFWHKIISVRKGKKI